MGKNISPDFRFFLKGTLLFVFQKVFKKRKFGVKIPLIENKQNMNYSSNLKMDLVNKFRRIIPLLISKKRDFTKSDLCFLLLLHSLCYQVS